MVELCLTSNQLTRLPDDIGELTSLQVVVMTLYDSSQDFTYEIYQFVTQKCNRTVGLVIKGIAISVEDLGFDSWSCQIGQCRQRPLRFFRAVIPRC